MPLSPEVSIVIINWNTRDLLLHCIKCIYETRGALDLEVIVVDNASSDDSLVVLRKHFPCVYIIANERNVGFARANNQGVSASRAPYVLLLNSDAFLMPGALQVMLDLLMREPRAALIGAQLLNTDGSFQASHTRFPNQWREFLILSGIGRALKGRWYPSHGDESDKGAQVVDYVEGACMLVRRDTYLQVGGLDEAFFMYAEEVDLCYRLRQLSWQVWYQPTAQVIHLGGGSSMHRRTQREIDLYRSRIHFFRKHYGRTAAVLLKSQIIAATAVKAIVHGALSRLGGERWGRRTVPIRELAAL